VWTAIDLSFVTFTLLQSQSRYQKV
jgi:hypothetical protein